MLFFAGGGGSIRGYAFRSIGVPFTNAEGENFTSGGQGIVEASGEVRYRFTADNWGAAAFVDTGFVTARSDLRGRQRLQGRHRPRGAVPHTDRRAQGDLATPLQPEPGDSRVALYIGIGQAF